MKVILDLTDGDQALRLLEIFQACDGLDDFALRVTPGQLQDLQRLLAPKNFRTGTEVRLSDGGRRARWTKVEVA